MIPAPLGWPTRIKVGHYWLTIEYFDAATEEREQKFGEFHANRHLIQISLTLHPFKLVEIFWHEVAHAAHHFFRAGDTLTEEELCCLSARTRVMVLIDNPQIHDWEGVMLFDPDILAEWRPSSHWLEGSEKAVSAAPVPL